MRILGVHGFRSSPHQHFWPWLVRELRAQGHEVIVPELPNPEAPDPDEWTKVMLDAARTLSDQDILIGHSLGGALALRFLEAAEARTVPKACVLTSSPWLITDERFRGFFLSELDHDVLMWRASRFAVIHAKNDPVIPYRHGEKYAEVFHAKLFLPEDGGHFNEQESYPIILNVLEDLIREPIVFSPGKTLPDDYADIVL